MKSLILLLILLSVSTVLFAQEGATSGKTALKEQAFTERQQAKHFKNQPPPIIGYSQERENLIKRVKRFNKPEKISYIYLITYGRIVAFYTVKGKVSSVNSQLTNPDAIVERSHQRPNVVVASPAEDGSYGTNGDAIFFFTADDVYIEWSGNFMLCDEPLKLTQKPMVQIIRKEKK